MGERILAELCGHHERVCRFLTQIRRLRKMRAVYGLSQFRQTHARWRPVLGRTLRPDRCVLANAPGLSGGGKENAYG